MNRDSKIINALCALLVFVSGLGITAVYVVSSYAYNKGVADGAMQATNSTPERLLEGQERIDDACISWLMESNLKEAKKRICGK